MTPSKAALPRPLPVTRSDLRGYARLGVHATVALTDLVEAMHRTIESTLGLSTGAPPGRTSGITGFVYRRVRGCTRLVGQGLDALLGPLLERLLPAETGADPPASASATSTTSDEREALRAAVNGICGDHLADSGNPLAIPMTLRLSGGQGLDPDAPPAGVSGRILLLVHGLCMNDRQWRRQGYDHGQALAAATGCTPVYLHYNSGRHVSQNGRELVPLLARLLAAWPVPVASLVIVGHSMGGLVARSACHLARQESALGGTAWLGALSALVCLGTPHHGAPLERGGRWIDLLLGLSRYAAPFARLGKARSAGITDLRWGNLQDADWRDRDRHAQHRDDRQPTPLPAGVPVYLVAATLTERPGSSLHAQTLGDGLVPLDSALGRHPDPAQALAVPPDRQRVVAGANHWDLLDRAEVTQALRDWLGATLSP